MTLAPRLAEVGIEPSNQNILAAILEMVDMELNPDTAFPCMDPNNPAVQLPPEDYERARDMMALSPEEQEAFWRRLHLKPPAPGSAPVLPSPDMLEEAKRRFPDIYGKPETEQDDS